MVCALFCVESLVSLLSFYLILRYIFKESPRTEKWRQVLCAVSSILADATGFLLLPLRTEYAFELLDFIATVIALFSIPLLFRKPRFWRGFAVLFLYYATIDTLWSFLATFFKTGILQESIFHLILTGAVCIAVYKGTNHKDLNIMAGAFHEIPVWLLVSLFLFELTNYYKEFGISETWYNLLYVISSCLVFLSILYLVFRVFRLVYTQNAIMRQLNDQLIQESNRIDSDERLRRFRHDLRNHTTVINAMLEQGEYDNAKQYFNSLTTDLYSPTTKYSTGNTVVDSLLNVQAQRASEQNISIVFDGAIPEQGIAPKDMCVCFGNLLDNAIDACATLPVGTERFVRIQSISQNNVLILSFVNPVASTKKIVSGELPKTTKKDVKAHGIGLRNVRDTAKKYNGSLHLSTGNEQFTAELLIELESDL